ncbi:sigma factor-like helix-turn-helix DNA-binding protein [Macrococcus armenti]|uniref:sigma factor-like helix-turn-helix DNA-binding protein n=1 Tax=Macrococcus armenti TaxID=2875764 RepID=UPI001CD02469|nr:sigma factor-like helix-turn-helix DNA-binding protein [Macrococcus armenti]UBH15783.1 hypothetical protein LAU44_02210 [Macrococcus armenti]UBH18142.1 hypothetical protein LAU39_02215 [Macrococcus armenti]UBH20409.1 hypothetical protein LAU40_02210 [Macrococcus armenti]
MENKALFDALLSVHKIIVNLNLTHYKDIQHPEFLEAIPKKAKEQILYLVNEKHIFENEEVIKKVNLFITSCHYLSFRSLNILITEDLLYKQEIEMLSSESILRLSNAGKKTVDEIIKLKSLLINGDASGTYKMLSKDSDGTEMSELFSADSAKKLEEKGIYALEDIILNDLSDIDLPKSEIQVINNIKKILNKNDMQNLFSIYEVWKHNSDKSLQDIFLELFGNDITLMFYSNGVLSKHLNTEFPIIGGKVLEVAKKLNLYDISKLSQLTYIDINRYINMSKLMGEKLKHLIINKVVVKHNNEIIYAAPEHYIFNKYKNNVLKTHDEKTFLSMIKYIESHIRVKRTFKDIELWMLNKNFHNLIAEYKKTFDYAFDIFNNLYANHRHLPYEKLEEKYNEIVLDVPMSEVITLLIKREIFSMNDENIITIRPRKIENVIKHMENSKSKTILELRLDGKTLEEIGNETGVTRERVRQIAEKEFGKIPKNLYEDRYYYIYENYDISIEIAKSIFQMAENEYYYLQNRYNKGNNPLEVLLEDETISLDDSVVERIKKYLNKDYIIIDNEKIKKNRLEIIAYLIKYFCSELTRIDDLYDLYHQFIEEFKLGDSFRINTKHSFEGYIERILNCIYYPRKRVKYYPLSSYDWNSFYNDLKIEDFMDKEISVLALYKCNSELMNEYKIEDHFELHNIIRRTYENHESKITMGRNPHIKIGNTDFEYQVLELLIEKAPMSQEEFLTEFCERYGFNRESIMGNNGLGCVESYLQNGFYHIDDSYINDINMVYLQDKFNEDKVYFIDEIKKDYIKNIGTELLATEYVFKLLGYKMQSSYIYPIKYSSMKDFLDKTIFNQDIVNISKLPYRMKDLSAFRSYILKIIENDKFIEFDYEKFISTNRLSENGMTNVVIDKFIDQVVNCLDDYKIYDLQAVLNKIDDNIFESYGFGLRFYESMFRRDKEDRRIHSLSVGGTLLIRKNMRINSFIDLLEQIIDEYRSFDVNDLIYFLNEEYHINISRGFILEKVKECDLYYNDIMEKIYIDVDYYYEELN